MGIWLKSAPLVLPLVAFGLLGNSFGQEGLSRKGVNRPLMALSSSVSYSASTGTISNLEANTSYQVTYVDLSKEEITTGSEETYYTYLSSSPSLGKTLQSICETGSAVSYALSGKVMGKLPTPNGALTANGLISNLASNSTYVLNTDYGIGIEASSDATGCIHIDDEHNTALFGFEFTNLKLKGDESLFYLDSNLQHFNPPWKMPTRIGLDANILFDKDIETFSNLVPKAAYRLYFNDGFVFPVSASISGTIDLRTISGVGGKYLKGLTKDGNLADDNKVESELYQLGSMPLILEYAKTPTAVFNGTLELENLEPESRYVLTCKDESYNFISDSSGKIVIDEVSGKKILIGKTITKILKCGDGLTTCDSLPQEVSYLVLVKQNTPNVTYTSSTGLLSGFEIGSNYEICFGDGIKVSFTPTADQPNFDVSTYLGITVSYVLKKGNGIYYADSEPQPLNLIVVPTARQNAQSAIKWVGVGILGLGVLVGLIALAHYLLQKREKSNNR
jgi:hypothetical protein